MKLSLILLVLAVMAWGQAEGPLMKSILPRYQAIKQNLLETAEAMPEADYSYRLTPAQRTFAEWMEHNVMMNYGMCSAVMGQAAPDTKKYHGLTAKADLQKALKESFDYCDQAFQGMTDEKALATVTVEGRPVTPVNSMIGLLANWNEHYGNLVGYLRTNGMVPPSTARAQKKQ